MNNDYKLTIDSGQWTIKTLVCCWGHPEQREGSHFIMNPSTVEILRNTQKDKQRSCHFERSREISSFNYYLFTISYTLNIRKVK